MGSDGELTARPLIVGALVGALLVLANLFLGLTTGVWDSGSITASVLGFALVSALPGRWGKGFGPRDNNLTQTVAAAAGAMPAAAGLLGAVPALGLLGGHAQAWVLLPWGLGLAGLGILLALALRERLIVQERLPFPTGVATAEVISALQRGGAEAVSRTRALLWAAGAALVVTWLRDGRPSVIPGLLALPGAILTIPAATLGLGLSVSPLMAGVGLVAGMSTGTGLLAGSLLAWGVLAPWAASQGFVAGSSWMPLARWVAWPGVALLVGAAAVSLAEQGRTFSQAGRDLWAAGREQRAADEGAGQPGGARGADGAFGLSGRWVLAGVAGLAVMILLSARALFGLPLGVGALALGLSLLLGSVCARSAGQTDIAPLGQVGELTQVSAGPLTAGSTIANVGAGGIVSGQAAQVGVTLWSLRAGHALGAPLRAQAVGALLGAGVGILVAVPAYALLAATYGIAGSRLPAPTALQFKALAELVAEGTRALPEGALLAIAIAAPAGVLLALLGKRIRWLPGPVAIGIGFLVPAHFAAAIFVGALAGEILRRRSPDAGRIGPVVGAGAIAGESVAGLVVALLAAAGWL